MQTRFTKLLVIACASATFSLAHNKGPELGKMAPDFKKNDIEGKEVSISDNKGKVIVLSWFSKDCPFDKKHHQGADGTMKGGNMQKLQEYAAEKGVVWISILSSAPGKSGYETDKTIRKVIEDHGVKATHIILDPDGKIGKTYQAKTTPHMFIIKKDGTIGYMGAIDSIKSTKYEDVEKAEPYFKNALEGIVEGKDFKPKQTVPYGCSVKYASD